ncbi:MAG: hypothetical protein JRI75_10575 [Deltaproteobacteria bacterium]|nr:hypothetical protein [Deltaproteobacteria bacterium]
MRQKIKILHRSELSIVFRFFFIAAVLSLVFLTPALGIEEKIQIQTKLPQQPVPQPQFFCGYCHILTYPGVVQKGYELWKKGKHNKFGCVECHYPPKQGEKLIQASMPGTALEKSHIPLNPPERFSYVPLGGETVKTRPRIVDASCMTAACHGKPEDTFKTKKIKFTEKVSFVHQPHLEKKNQIEGQKINCTSCHQHETDKKKFEVTKTSCHLCHFKNTKFNQERGKCELCHELPKKPIQTSGDKPITHEMLKKAKVPCASCHIELVQASGGGKYEAYFEDGELKTALVLGAGRVKKESCLTCHDQEKALKETDNKKLMHEKHVTVKTARCLECHQPILHVKADLNPPVIEGKTRAEKKQPKMNACAACHPDPHRFQRMLAEGRKRKGVSNTPDFMYKVRTNCLGCHVEKKFTNKGQMVLGASSKTCVRCHTKDHKKMLKDWNKELAEEIKYSEEVEQEALKAFAKAKPELSESRMAEARKILKEGQENLNIVRFGNGVHNKKYSIMLIDAAIGRFEDMIDFLEEGE